VLGEKLMYNQPLFRNIEDSRFLAPAFIPIGTSGEENAPIDKREKDEENVPNDNER
jgi:hypothetical protein